MSNPVWVSASNTVMYSEIRVNEVAQTRYVPVIASSGESLRYLHPVTVAPGWRIASPIMVKVEKDEDGEYIVTDTFSIVYGNGRSEAEAISDYVSSLIDFYEVMEGQSENSVRAALSFAKLKAYVNRTKK